MSELLESEKAHEEKEPSALAEEYEQKGRQAFFMERYEEALAALQDAIVLYKHLRLTEKFVNALITQGVVYSVMGNESVAVDNYLEALEYAEDYEISNSIPLLYNNIGSRYQELGKHQKAIYYFNKAEARLNKWKETGDGSRFHSLKVVIFLNIVFSCSVLGQYSVAEHYLDMVERLMEEKEVPGYNFTLLYLKSRLYWHTGRREFVREHLQEMMLQVENERGGADYVQNIQEFNDMLREMGECACWEKSIQFFEEYAEEQDIGFFRLVAVEMRMEYCQYIKDEQQYNMLCIEHTKLYQMQKEANIQERSHALDVKIALREQEEQRKKAERMNETLKQKSEMDALTQVGNRYSLEVKSVEVVKQFSKESRLLTVGVIDIDCFKQVNDTYGHAKGDECLVKVAKIIRNAVKDYGCVFRFGGDEFVLLITKGDYETAEEIAQTIKAELAKQCIENKHSIVIPTLTVSQGYACFIPAPNTKTADLLEHADRALYKVKNTMRNDYRLLLENIPIE